MNTAPRFIAAAVLLFAGTPVWAGQGILGLDHRLHYDNSGIWARHNQNVLIAAMIGGELGLGLWEGGDNRLGKTAWQAVDASALAGLSSNVMKPVFGRLRPNATPDPDQWHQGGNSFPSGEVSSITAMVTPFILEYLKDDPAVYALALLPAYDAVARMKVWGHWQSDVLAGAVVGAASGYWAHRRKSPFVLGLLPDGVAVGLHKRF